ncbi:Multidrug resistance protein MdtA precursor [Maioricimonas rarisocia]|uniref:Multidrug resistance protein MdtA n=1 Tax=Maioricimonas rarisocia TaxID=2528026 RepID=A0A517Z5M5_9PLAN|nr:efflux RND transporter periplasmic adaptor subunit [Maioricimonas rarisocia]QDU37757.1 Multidrug resistance protein MdtA precursor [Maioricimonas rarisocia]
MVLGSVEPAQEIVLSPRVSGQVLELAPNFVPGGMVQKGDLLLQIDPADFTSVLSERQSALQQAEASLEIERGRQSLARKELDLLVDTIEEANRSLVLREPQIKSIRAQVDAAKALVARAQLELDRTKIEAPFDAQILSRSVNVGSQVAPGDELARLVGIEKYWVIATVPVRSLHWVQFSEADGEGSSATLHNPNTWLPGAERHATVSRMIGALDQQTRLARVVMTVEDPLARNTEGPPLILDTLLQAHINGRPIEDVIRLDRDYVHERDTVWVMKDGKLEIRETDIVFRDADHAYIQDGLESGEEVVTTTLATVANGIGLRKVNESAPEDESLNTEAAD